MRYDKYGWEGVEIFFVPVEHVGTLFLTKDVRKRLTFVQKTKTSVSMKKLFKYAVAIALFCFSGSSLFAQSSGDSTLVELSLILPGNNQSVPHRTPAHVLVPVVVQDNLAGLLSFSIDGDCAPIPYSIYDENDNIVLGGTLIFDDNGECSVSVGSLTSGTYRLQLEIGSFVFSGTFYREEE